MSNTLTNETHQRGLKDFLTLYNTITEYCFNKCVSKFNERMASDTETTCVEVCSDNYVQFNQRFMFNFVDHQERRKRDNERTAAEAAAKEQEQQQQQLQQAAADFVAGQEQGVADMAAAASTVSPSHIPADLPLKTDQATHLLETLSGAAEVASNKSGSLNPGDVLLSNSNAQSSSTSNSEVR